MMAFVNHNGVQIHYKVTGTGTPLIMAHGTSLSGEDWHELGYVAALSDKYQVITVDSRGHGKSAKLYDPAAYEPEMQVNDYLAVLDELGVTKAIFWGFSSGAAIMFNVIQFAPERVIALIIGGLHPYPNDYEMADESPPGEKGMQGLPEVGPDEDPISALMRTGGEAWLRFFESNMEMPPGMKQRVKDNDFQALLTERNADFEWKAFYTLLPTCQIPTLLYVGDSEGAYAGMKHCASEMPNAKFAVIPNATHFDIIANAQDILPHVQKFLRTL